ncbi:MAG: DNA polymerase III subunit beta [Candidatus Magasanikbacteria bacterium]
MKFVCTKENLTRVLEGCSGVTNKQAHLPILSNVLFETDESGVRVVVTNLEIAIKAHLRAKVENKGSFTVPAKTLIDYVRLLSEDQVHIELQENQLIVQSGSSSTKIKGTPADEFPVIPEIEETIAYTIREDVLRDGIGKTAIAAAKNEIRPELSGVYCKFFGTETGLTMAATDSYRLAETKIPISQGQEEFTCIVPAQSMYEISKLLSGDKSEGEKEGVRIWLSDSQIGVRYGVFEMTSRLIDGTYPDYTQIIPSEFKTTTELPLDVLVKKIKAASLFTTTGVNAVSFDLNVEQGTVGISSTSTQTGEHTSEVDALVVGDENSILLNHRYVLDGLGQIETDIVEFCVNGSDAPCLFRPKGSENYLYIVMPIRQ